MIKLTLVLLLAALARAQQDPYEVCVGHADGEMVGHGQDVSCTAYFYCEGEYGFDEDCVTQLGDGHEFNYETNECDLSENVLCADYVAPEPETDAPPPPQVPVTQPPATQPPVVTPAPPATTDSSIPDITCPTNRPGEIIFFESTNCTEYFICANGVRLQMACMEGFTWNQAERQCDYPIFSRCSSNIADDGLNVQCTRTGFYTTAYPRDCTKFVFCSLGIPMVQNCPIGYAWHIDRCIDRIYASCPDLRRLPIQIG